MGNPSYVYRWSMLNKGGKPPPHPGHQPFVALGVRMYGFIFRGEQSNLETLCDRYLCQPSGGAVDFKPAPPYWVLLTFTETRELASENPPFKDMGCAPEREAAFWVALQTGDAQEPTASFAPYMFVDNPIAMIQGREIYGFPKEIGWFEGFPRELQEPTRLTVDTYGVPAFGPTSRACQLRLFEVNRTGGLGASVTAAWKSLDQAQTAFANSGLQLPGALLVPPTMGMVFLKQIPNVSDGRLAAYQAIVKAGSAVKVIRAGGPLPGAYELTINRLDSHPIGSDLGLQTTQPAEFGYWLDFDFVFQNGTVLWEA